MSERSFESVYKELQSNVESRSHLVNLLPALRRAHLREMKEAAKGFLDDWYADDEGYEYVRDNANYISAKMVFDHARDCDREDLIKRLMDYYLHPEKRNPEREFFDGLPFTDDTIHYDIVRQIIMEPNHEWSARDFFSRLRYLLGEDHLIYDLIDEQKGDDE